MAELVLDRRLLVERERAADLRQHLGWGDRARPVVGVGHQLHQDLTPVGVVTLRRLARHSHSMRLASKSWVGGVDQHQLLAQLLQQPAQQPRPLGCGHPAVRLRAGHRAAQLGAQRGGAAVAQSSCRRASPPAQAVLLAIGAMGCTSRWPPRPARDHTRVRAGCNATLDLVFQVQVCVAQPPQQPRQVLAEQLFGQGGIGDQAADGWRQR
jgi:hypothetical protein